MKTTEFACSDALDAGCSSCDLLEVDSLAGCFHGLVFEAHGASPGVVWIWSPLVYKIIDVVVWVDIDLVDNSCVMNYFHDLCITVDIFIQQFVEFFAWFELIFCILFFLISFLNFILNFFQFCLKFVIFSIQILET